MNRQIVERAMELYGIRPVKIHDEMSGYRNKSYRVEVRDHADLNLIIFKPEPGILDRINRADAVSEHVAARGLPARRRFDPRTMQLTGASGRIHYVRIYEYLPGATIPWEEYTKKHIKLLGWAMSDFHHAATDYDGDLPDGLDICRRQLAAMKKYFADDHVRGAMRRKLKLTIGPAVLDLLADGLMRAKNLSPTIPLHLDLVRGNVLYGDGGAWQIGDVSLTGLIDFEKVARGPAVLDLARTYAFLIVDSSRKSPEKIFKYLIHSGYNKRGKNQVDFPASIFWSLVRFFLLYDFYKFLCHNPYEHLGENHHFRLTRNMLIRKNMIEYI